MPPGYGVFRLEALKKRHEILHALLEMFCIQRKLVPEGAVYNDVKFTTAFVTA